MRKKLPASLQEAIQTSLATMQERPPEAFEGGAFVGGFVKVDDAKYRAIRELNEAAKQLAALK